MSSVTQARWKLPHELRCFAAWCLALAVLAPHQGAAQEPASPRPNVILIITDDQGYGDIGAHGNSMIRTPHLDALHKECVRLTDFHVDPTCSPTRAALMTGRYSTRTGVWHTIQGRSLMSPDEVTLAKMFAANGYRTGLFGKWHLGDNAPLRPQDQGFQTALYHGGGGVGQTPDWWGNDYFDDTCLHEDGTAEQFTGYCTDVWFDNALRFIESHRQSQQPFFCYLATNTPHGPYRVDPVEKQPYLDAGVPEPMASFYAMITVIDRNLGRLLKHLEDQDLAQNTILIFMTDNGTAAGVRGPRRKGDAWSGFNAGMRGQKGSEYDGGHRVPFWIRWPGGDIGGDRDIDALAAHIDVLPTLAELCNVERPDGPPLDGRSLASLLRGLQDSGEDRTLCVHSQRLETPQKWRKSAVLTARWRLVNGSELYDIKADPAQENNIASDHPAVVTQLRQAYEEWWESLSPVFDEYVRIDLGSEAENPAQLTAHDWHTGNGSDASQQVPWSQVAVSKDPLHNGYWAVNVTTPGRYEFALRMRPAGVICDLPPGQARLRIGDVEQSVPIEQGQFVASMTVDLAAGPATLQTWLIDDEGRERGACFVQVRRLGPREN